MFSGQDIFQYQNRAPSEEAFKHLGPSFASAYETAIQKFGSENFLKVYKKNGETVSKTFSQFASDVEAVKSLLFSQTKNSEVLVTIDGNTYEHLVFITAGLLLGIVVSPMNPLEGVERFKQKIKQISQPCLVATGSAYFDEVRKIDHLRTVEMQIPDSSQGPLVANANRSLKDPFIYIFTSGSTGYSKIVMQPEVAVLSNVDALIELHGLHNNRKVIATPLPVFHVNALEFSFFCSLLSGQRLVLYEQFDFFRILDSLSEDKVQIFSAIPQVLKTFADMAAKIRSRDLNLEYCVTAAASLSPDLAKKLTATFQFKIIQGYGLSEAVNFSLKIPPSLSKERVDYWLTQFSRPSIGTELRGNDVFILSSENGLALGEGEEGELCIRGHNVMLGYKDQDNRQVFAGNYLHTGDRGFFKVCQETGRKFYFISGRIKDVIKRLGQTVSLVEIDDCLVKWYPQGVHAIAVPFANKYSGEEIGIVCSGAVNPEQLEDLKNVLTREIPAFMRPRVIATSVSKLTTESGKPKRWEFASLFDAYKDTSLGEVPIIHKMAPK